MTVSKEIYKTYGLTGKTVRITVRDDMFTVVPIKDMTIPVKIVAEYKKFLCGIVLPHQNPAGIYKSNPYPITIDKYKLFSKAIIMRVEGA